MVVLRVLVAGSERDDFKEVDPRRPRGSRACDFPGSHAASDRCGLSHGTDVGRSLVLVDFVAAGERIDFKEVDPREPRGSRGCDFRRGRAVSVLCCFARRITVEAAVGLVVVRAVSATGLSESGAGEAVGSRAEDFHRGRGVRVLCGFARDGGVHIIVIRRVGRGTWGHQRGHRDALHPLGVSPLRNVNRNGRYRSCLALRSLITLRHESILFGLPVSGNPTNGAV